MSGQPANEPYIVAMVNDGKQLDSDFLRDGQKLFSKQVAVCFAGYRNLAQIARMRVAWANGQLRLWLNLDGPSSGSQLCLETTVGDARMATLPTSGYFGLSASTGSYGDAHVLYSVSVAKLDPLLDDVVLAKPHVAAPGEAPIDPSHEVHSEAADHATHMKVVPNEVPIEHHAEPGAGAHQPMSCLHGRCSPCGPPTSPDRVAPSIAAPAACRISCASRAAAPDACARAAVAVRVGAARARDHGNGAIA